MYVGMIKTNKETYIKKRKNRAKLNSPILLYAFLRGEIS